MSLYIYKPRIHLFAFSAKENTNPRKVIDKKWVWDKCNKIISRTLSQNFDIFDQINLDTSTTNLIKHFQDEDVYYPIFFDGNANVIFDKSNQDEDLMLQHENNSSIYAVQIDENYGLGINLNHPIVANHKVEISQLRFINPPDNVLILGNKESDSNQFVGQTLLITAQLLEQDENKTNKELKNIAKQCIKALFPNDHYLYPFNRQGQLFNSPIFEYGSLKRKNLEPYQHILVWFFSDRQEREKFYKNYNDFLDLFLYRARIINVLKEIRRQENLIAKDLKEINDQINSIHFRANNNTTKKELEFLKYKLTKLPKMAREYGIKIGKMYEFESSSVVKDNSKYYIEKLIELEKNTDFFSEKDISYLKTFAEKTCKDFLEKTAAKLKYFEHSSTLANSAIASVRGQIAIEQTELEIQRQKHERKSQYNQEITILAIGSGIAAGEIFASSYGLIQKEQLPLLTLPYIHPFFLSIFYSLLFGFFVAIFIWITPQMWKFTKVTAIQRSKRLNKKNQEK